MLVISVWVIELLSIFICLYKLYNKRIKINKNLVINFSLMITTLLIVNFGGLPNFYSFISYIFFCIFCCIEYKETIMRAIVSIVLCIIIVAIIQFVSMLVLSFISFGNLDIRDLCGCILTLLLVVFCLRGAKLSRLREAILCRHWLVYLICFFIISVIVIALFVLKKQEIINLGLFVFGIPSIAIILFLLSYWERSLKTEQYMQKEIDMILSMQESYDDLVNSVKINQHSMKNHLMAVMSSQQNNNLVSDDAQEYMNILYSEAKYNNLLLIGNQTLSGFLYKKIKESESENIIISYKIKTQYEKSMMPIYYLIEILGILFDNAIEASLEQCADPEIYFEICEDNSNYVIRIRNTYRIVPYEEIEKWFEFGRSNKGKERGVGLYRVKKLCKEWYGDVSCHNIQMNDKNWIQFVLVVGMKKDGE